MCGADCWPVSESGTENILASDWSSESPIVPNPWWFFVAGKDSSRLRFGSKYSTLSWIFRKDRIVSVSWRWFPRPRSSSVVVRDFCSMTVRAHHCRTVSSLEVCFLPFLGSSTPAILPVFLRPIAIALMLYLNSKSGVRDNGKRFVERQKAKEMINGGSQVDFIDELL